MGKGVRTLDTRNHNPVLSQLSYTHHIVKNGTPRGIRTPGLLLRRQLLYPTELLAHMPQPLPNWLERVMGIEPTYPAWKAGVLPLNYTREGLSHISALRIYHYQRGFVKSNFENAANFCAKQRRQKTITSFCRRASTSSPYGSPFKSETMFRI